jgi:hypothetical protein
VGRLRHVRLDFLLKLYFLWEQDRGRVPELLEKQIEFCDRYLEEWRERAEAAGPASFERLAIEAKMAVAEGTLRWLEQCDRLLGAGVVVGKAR